ncbi:DUF5666 domain-containing protein [Mycolicibacter kumamotonensis]|uniref:DUF5666 domain-containing protein n=1 Tax=Mycolicibacter kumamotonensis TaxID=354243 RepID=UPI001F18F7FD|nr:DUF5666 domain-containing protein [Mycolicibacter kumamotonensis]
MTGFAVLAVAAATGLTVGACSSSDKSDKSDNAQSSASASSPTSSKAKNKDVVQGQVASVAGNAVQVTEDGGTSTVDLNSATITDYDKAQLTDVAVGNCVSVVAKPAPGGPATAISVALNPPAGDGKCPQPKPAAAGSPDAPGPNQPFTVVGTVASVAGDTIDVADTDANGNPSQTGVTATDKTTYVKGVSADSEAVAQGKCITARGTLDGGGTLQATFVSVAPVNAKGQCPPPHAK